MSEERQFQLKLERCPLSVDASDLQGLREALRSRASDTAALTGALSNELLFAGPGYLETMDIKSLLDDDQQHFTAAFLRRYEGDGQVKRRFRQGVAHFRIEGTLRRVVVLLECTSDEPLCWWHTWRIFGVNAAQVGVWHGPWNEEQGQGVEALREELREWVDVGEAELLAQQRTLQENPASEDIRMAVMEFRGELPEDPREIASILGQHLDSEIVAHGLPRLLILAFRPSVLERWEISGKQRVSLDELIRAIACQSPVLAMAIVHPSVVEMTNGEKYRSVTILVERDGRRGQRVLPLRVHEGKGQAGKPVFEDRGTVPPEHRWIGVPPKVDIGLVALGPLEMPMGTIGEA